MSGIFSFFAPRRWRDAVLLFFLFEVLINLLNLASLTLVLGLGADLLWRGAAMCTLISAPFVILTLSLLSHQRGLQDRLAHLAATDLLTGLPNRRAFLEQAEQAARAAPEGVLLVLDVDHFKRVNDSYGHAVGDLCLQAIGEHLRGAARAGDVLGRIGGEEFAIYLPGIACAAAAEIGHRLSHGIRLSLPDDILPPPRATDLTVPPRSLSDLTVPPRGLAERSPPVWTDRTVPPWSLPPLPRPDTPMLAAEDQTRRGASAHAQWAVGEAGGAAAPARTRELAVTISVGASRRMPDVSLTEAMKRADMALYRAKATGRARLVRWSEISAAPDPVPPPQGARIVVIPA